MDLDTPKIEPGDVIDGRFEVQGEIASGAFGVVFHAVDREDGGADVALKTVRPEVFSRPKLVERFLQEITICQRLRHPHTARVRASGRHLVGPRGPELPYLVLDLVRGLPLGVVVDERGPLDDDETAHVLGALLASLAEAHGLGIVHRDLKPNNVLIEARESRVGELRSGDTVAERLGVPGPTDRTWADLTDHGVKVVDFGLGKIIAGKGRRARPLTTLGKAAGTPHYMSPEQVRGGRDIDYRSDLYGVGMLLYRVIAGRPAFRGSIGEIALSQLRDPPPPLPEPWTDHPLAAVYERATRKEPDERYASANEMGWALRCAVDQSLADAPAPSFERPPRPEGPSILTRIMDLFSG